ncbi:MAG: hypothetical protein IKS11_09880 [Lachnospiraceae bacterium]|nr:hypothetical protein [Lachnospiraceae bacterium]
MRDEKTYTDEEMAPSQDRLLKKREYAKRNDAPAVHAKLWGNREQGIKKGQTK